MSNNIDYESSLGEFWPSSLNYGDQRPNIGATISHIRELANGTKAIFFANVINLNGSVVIVPRHCHVEGIGKVAISTQGMRWSIDRTFLEIATTRPIATIGLAEDALAYWANRVVFR